MCPASERKGELEPFTCSGSTNSLSSPSFPSPPHPTPNPPVLGQALLQFGVLLLPKPAVYLLCGQVWGRRGPWWVSGCKEMGKARTPLVDGQTRATAVPRGELRHAAPFFAPASQPDVGSGRVRIDQGPTTSHPFLLGGPLPPQQMPAVVQPALRTCVPRRKRCACARVQRFEIVLAGWCRSWGVALAGALLPRSPQPPRPMQFLQPGAAPTPHLQRRQEFVHAACAFRDCGQLCPAVGQGVHAAAHLLLDLAPPFATTNQRPARDVVTPLQHPSQGPLTMGRPLLKPLPTLFSPPPSTHAPTHPIQPPPPHRPVA